MNNVNLSSNGVSEHTMHIDSGISSQPVLPVGQDQALASIGRVMVIGVFAFVALFLLQLALDHFRNPGRFPIRSVVVEGVYQFADKGQMRDRVMTQASLGFFNLDIEDIQRNVEELPWVKNAYVRRVWPESITVHVEEHKPVARWGDRSLVTDGFKLFTPPQLKGTAEPRLKELVDGLPMLYSPERRHVSLLRLLNETRFLLDQVEAPLEGMVEDERRSLTLHLKNDVKVVIGHREVEKRIKRFSEIFRPYVAPVYDDIAKVDMRYTNGFAMARKSTVSEKLRVQ